MRVAMHVADIIGDPGQPDVLGIVDRAAVSVDECLTQDSVLQPPAGLAAGDVMARAT
jgi:hypothetical protein